MRLISQKGWGYIDIEYENGTITMDYTSEGTRIIYSWNDDSGECVIMAEYSSRKKAKGTGRYDEDVRKLHIL